MKKLNINRQNKQKQKTLGKNIIFYYELRNLRERITKFKEILSEICFACAVIRSCVCVRIFCVDGNSHRKIGKNIAPIYAKA